MRLLRQPPAVKTLMVSFQSLAAAGDAVSALIAAGLVPATLEVIDQSGMRVIEDFCDAGLPVAAGAVLIAEVDGYEQGLEAQKAEVAELLEKHGGYDLHVARNEAERQRIWYGRKSAAGAMARLAPSYYLTDVTVRRSRLAKVLARVEEICGRYDLRTANFFHAGDGNLHPLIPGDPEDPVWVENVHRAVREIIDVCIEEDGSITGEHGVGLEKRSDMLRMYGGAELSAMRDIKQAFDPGHLLNPGKVLPDDIPEPALAEPSPAQGDACAPASAREAAGVLRALTAAGSRVWIGSAETQDGSPAGAGSDVRLSTSRLRGIHDFAPEDLFVTVGAGTRIEDIQAFLEPHALRVPLVAPWPAATAGGLVATNCNAPLRLRYGSLRDVTLCATVALADGRLLRAGRPLVKNVAGYDLTRAFIGSYGTLGLLTEVTFKLIPEPRARRTLALPVSSLEAGLRMARLAYGQALVASAIVIVQGFPLAGVESSAVTLLYTAEGLPQDVDAELAAVRGAWQEGSASGGASEDGASEDGAGQPVETSLSGTDAWARFAVAAEQESLLVRIGVPGKDLEAFLPTLPAPAGRHLIDVAAGLIYCARRPQSVEAAGADLEALRRPARAAGGYAVAMRVPARCRAALDPWGHQPAAIDVMRRLKELWDPAGILNPGVFF